MRKDIAVASALLLGLAIGYGMPTRQAPALDFGPAANVHTPLQSTDWSSSPSAWPPSKTAGGLTLDIRRLDPPRVGGIVHEPVLAGYHKNGVDHLVAGWHHIEVGPVNDELKIGASVSHDGGSSWQSSVLPQPTTPRELHFDPYAAADGASETLWLGGVSRLAGGLFLSEARGLGGLQAPRQIGDMNEDKVAATFGGNPPALVVVGTHNWRRSLDFGASFQRVPLGLSNLSGYFPVIFPDNEIVAVAYQANPGRLVLRRARNSPGPEAIELVRTLRIDTVNQLDAQVAGSFRVAPFGQLAKAPDGALFYAYSDVVGPSSSGSDIDVFVIKSLDRGRTWGDPVRVTSDSSGKDQFLPALAVDQKSRLHLAYFDTRRGNAQDSDPNALVDVVYAFSADGITFQESFLTQTPFQSSRSSWAAYGVRDIFIGDYLAVVAPKETAYVAFPEVLADQSAMQLARINAGFAIGAGTTGAWYDPQQAGHGLFLEVLSGQRFLAWWFTFDAQGKQAWFGGVGSYSGNRAVINEVYLTEGGRWIPNFNASNVNNRLLGKLRFEFQNCSSGKVEFESTDPNWGVGSMNLTRLSLPEGLSCRDTLEQAM